MGSGLPLFGQFVGLNPYTKTHRSLTKALEINATCVHPYLSTLENPPRAVEANSRAMSRDAKTVANWDFHRIIPCHGVNCPSFILCTLFLMPTPNRTSSR